ncbi:MAG: GDSL-type esterase/lipase family protein [Flavobacteriales bacterium]
MTRFCLLSLLLAFVAVRALSQLCGQEYGPHIDAIHSMASELPGERERLVMVGSSTFRLWPRTDTVFSHFEVVNAGFGGSCFSDLWRLRESLIFGLKPNVLVIYEGDNDLSDGLPTSEVFRVADLLLDDVSRRLPETRVVLVAPKPSPARAYLQDHYLSLHQHLEPLCREHSVVWVNFWDVMHDGGRLREEWFLQDQLHLNNDGYSAWTKELREQVPWLDPARRGLARD